MSSRPYINQLSKKSQEDLLKFLEYAKSELKNKKTSEFLEYSRLLLKNEDALEFLAQYLLIYRNMWEGKNRDEQNAFYSDVIRNLKWQIIEDGEEATRMNLLSNLEANFESIEEQFADLLTPKTPLEILEKMSKFITCPECGNISKQFYCQKCQKWSMTSLGTCILCNNQVDSLTCEKCNAIILIR